MSKYIISWNEFVTVITPCWWRRLLGLPFRTRSEWQRKVMTIKLDEGKFECWTNSDIPVVQVEVQVQVEREEESPLLLYCNGSFSTGYSRSTSPPYESRSTRNEV